MTMDRNSLVAITVIVLVSLSAAFWTLIQAPSKANSGSGPIAQQQSPANPSPQPPSAPIRNATGAQFGLQASADSQVPADTDPTLVNIDNDLKDLDSMMADLQSLDSDLTKEEANITV